MSIKWNNTQNGLYDSVLTHSHLLSRMSSLIGTLEGDVEIGASAEKFFVAVCYEPNKLTSICPDVIKSCDLLDGVWGTLGAITQWKFVLGGEAKSIKLIISLVDPINKSVTYGLMEGDLKSEFSSLAVEIKATDMGEGCKVHLAMAYVKLSLTGSPPQALFDLGIEVFKLIGEYLAKA